MKLLTSLLLTLLLMASAVAFSDNAPLHNSVIDCPDKDNPPEKVAISKTIRLSKPVAQDAISETFGSVLDESLPKVSLADIAGEAEKYLGTPMQVETKIAKVCQKKGCFFIAQQGPHIIRVSFRDYGFFIPTDTGGKTVILAGTLIKKEMSTEQAEHFKQDLNTNAEFIKTGVVYELVADSVRIPRST